MKVYKPVEDGHYEFLIGRYAYIEEDGKRFGMNVPEYDCNTGEWLESPCYVDMHDIKLCRLVEQPDAPAVPSTEVLATLRTALRLLDADLTTNHTYMKKHKDEVMRLHAAFKWLDELDEGA